MNVISTSTSKLSTRRLDIGFEGENERTQVRIDATKEFTEYPQASPTLAVKPGFGEEVYPVIVTKEGNEVVWIVTQDNLDFTGDGEIQLNFVKDSVICKTVIGKIHVDRSLIVNVDPPEHIDTWYDEATAKLADVDEAVNALEAIDAIASGLPAGSDPTVTLRYVEALGHKRFTFQIPKGDRGERGATGNGIRSISQSGSTGLYKKYTIHFTDGNTTTFQVRDGDRGLKGDTGATPDISIGTVETLPAGSEATASMSGTAENPLLNLGIPKGDKGDMGEKGDKGDRGATPIFSMGAVTNLPAGTSATATITGTAEEPVLNLGIPKGDKGDKGDRGERGPQGIQGIQGDRGLTGPKGEKGDKGDKGDIGATGATGATPDLSIGTVSTLPAGSSATAEITGTAENPVLSLGIPQGIQGEQGVQGEKGEKGDPGEVTTEQMDAAIDEALQDYARTDGYYPDMTVGNAEQLNSSKFVENSEPYTLRTSGGSSDIGNREYLDAVVGGTVAWNQAVRDSASENSTDFAPIVTVTDAVEDAAGVKVKIEPVQDLHGYDHPWPAGGGKNLLDINSIVVGNTSNWSVDVNGDTLTVTHKTSYTSGTPTFAFNQPSGTYVISIGSINITGQVSLYVNGSWTKTINNGDTFTIDAANTNEIKFSAQEDQSTIITKIQIESGNTATSYEPYSNICPITGWDGVQVWDDPKYGGLIEWNQQCNTLSIGGDTSDLAYTFGNNGSVIITGTSNKSDWKNIKMFTDKSNHLMLAIASPVFPEGFSLGASYNNNARSHMFMLGEGNQYLRFAFTSGTVMNYNGHVNIFDLTQMFGETEANRIYSLEQATYGAGLAYFRSLFPADYYPYNEGEITTVSAVNGDPYRHYSITLPTEAGTVYGGELTVNEDGSGSLVVDRAEADMGTLNWTYNSGNNRFDGPSISSSKRWDDHAVTANAVCECLKTVSFYELYHLYQEVDSAFAFDAKLLRARSTAFGTDADAFKTAMSGIKLVYELATPITYTLTASEIRTLLGTNNVWADTGDLALTYTGTDEHLTFESGKKYLARLSGTDSMLLGSGQEITAAKGTDNVFDLTQMFGTAVADYVYGQGAAFFRKWFPNARYPYNAGELRHVEGLSAHDMVGFNQWDEEWELGDLNTVTGGNYPATNRIRSKNYIPIFPNTQYYFKSSVYAAVCYYDANKNYITPNTTFNPNSTSTTYRNAYYMRFTMGTAYGTTYKHDICISLAHNGSRNGEYEPYEKHSYPLDSSVILRGIPKVGANGVYWDGDRYLPDGTVERRYGVIDMGTMNWGRSQLGSSGFYFFYSGMYSLENKPKYLASGLTSNCYTVSVSGAGAAWNYEDRTLVIGNSSTYPVAYIRDDSFTDASAFTAAMQGVLLVYELAEPTTETAQPYHSTQWVSDWGTEEFVSTGIVPVGSETRYPANLRDKLQHLPDAASGNGSYLITQTDGQMVLTPFPAPPSTAGNYFLKATVTNGVATYTWEAAT